MTIIITAVTIALSVMTAVVGFIVNMALSVAAAFIVQAIFSTVLPSGSNDLVHTLSGNMDHDDINQSLTVME